jgi:LPS sulfotransferase NodH
MNAQRMVTRGLPHAGRRRHISARRTPAARASSRRTHGPIPTSTYIICTNPRSGSWLLSEGLASTSLAGNPREWFNVQQEQQSRAQWRIDNQTDLTFAGYLGVARRESMTANGISGVKLHYYQFADLPQRMQALPGSRGMSAAELMTAMFPGAKYIWLTRRDKVRQAISLYLASHTNEWWSIDGHTHRQASGSTTDIDFDPTAIAAFESLLEENDRNWQAFFDSNHITPLLIEYESFACDYAVTIRKALESLGIAGSEHVTLAPPRLRRQSTARSEEWVARYTAVKGEQSALSTSAAELAASALFKPPMPLTVVPDLWKQWVAHARLLGYTSTKIAEVLITNGYSPQAAHAEAQTAAADPYVAGSLRHQQRLKKAAALLNAQGQLRRLDSRANVVERRDPLSPDEFRDEYYASNRPVIMRDMVSDWKAVTAWTPDYLKQIAGQSIIEVMTGRAADPRYEINNHRHRTKTRFAAYIDTVHSGKVTNDYYMTANNVFFQRPGTQGLLNDLTPLPQYLTPNVDGQYCFLWFGPAGTVTPLHHDTSNILMAQVVGRKRFRLVAPEHWQYLYNNVGVFSGVDCEAPDFARHPNFRHADVADIILEPGDALFMPVGWWHHARALDVSMTVTFTNFIYPNRFNWE